MTTEQRAKIKALASKYAQRHAAAEVAHEIGATAASRDKRDVLERQAWRELVAAIDEAP